MARASRDPETGEDYQTRGSLEALRKVLSRRFYPRYVGPRARDIAGIDVISHDLWVHHRLRWDPEKRNGGMLHEHRFATTAPALVLFLLVECRDSVKRALV